MKKEPTFQDLNKQRITRNDKPNFQNDRFRIRPQDSIDYKEPDKIKIKPKNLFNRQRLHRTHIATSSVFYSEQDILNEIKKDKEDILKHGEVRVLDPSKVEFETKLLPREKAALLAKKYKLHNSFLRKMSYRKFLTQSQIDAIFKCVEHEKQKILNKVDGNES